MIVSAVPSEVDRLVGWFETVESCDAGWTTIQAGGLGRLQVGLACLGIGKVNAAAGAAALIEHFRPAMVWVIGSAGAYPQGPLRLGDVLVSSSVSLGDEGVWERHGIRGMDTLGFPVGIERGSPVFDRFHLSEDPLWKAVAQLTPPGLYCLGEALKGLPVALPCAVGSSSRSAVQEPPMGEPPTGAFQVLFGPSVTVSMSSGDEWVAKERFTRYDAWAEDMEGSAVVQVCRRYEVSVVQCRGVSNWAGLRDRSTWCMKEAMAHGHAVLGTWLETIRRKPEDFFCPPKEGLRR